MIPFKSVLERKREELLSVLAKAQKDYADAPEGSLRTSKVRNSVRYYHYTEGKKPNGIYIPRSEVTLARKLAQKDYNYKVICLAKKRIQQINEILCDYQEEEFLRLYENQKDARKDLIVPWEKPWEQQRELWEAKTYEGKRIDPNEPFFLTKKGEKVRSKSEKIIADMLCDFDIPYKYECPLRLAGGRTIYPDFTCLSRKTRSEIIWEHFGMMDSQEYVRNQIRKRREYEKTDYWLGEKLIFTQENLLEPLNMKDVERLIRKYLI